MIVSDSTCDQKSENDFTLNLYVGCEKKLFFKQDQNLPQNMFHAKGAVTKFSLEPKNIS